MLTTLFERRWCFRLTRVLLLAFGTVMLPGVGASAQPAAIASVANDSAAFITDLSARVFALMRDNSTGESQRRGALRAMLTDNFALQQIGDRLIRRYRATITPQQYASYRAVLPGFVVGAYADRLEGYKDAQLRIVRTLPRGSAGDGDVFARVLQPGQKPIDTVWAVRRVGDRLKITNLTVSGVNLAVVQEEDFNAKIQRDGFDALVAFMRKSQA